MTNEIEQEIERMENEAIRQQTITNEIIKERRNKALLTVNEICPTCGQYPLEEDIFGYEKSIFCVNCPYHRTEEM